MSVKPYQIQIPQEELDVLKRKLELANFPNELEDAGWEYGTPLADIKKLTTYWKDSYDWRKAEAKLNLLPQFTTEVQIASFGNLKVHFVHQRSKIENAIPLLFIHGWPGNFMEVSKILSGLTAPSSGDQPAFHVVAPSLPGYAFSEAPLQKGFAVPQYAEACHKVMLNLGYEEYVTQGGDWGFWIARMIGRMYPQHCKASHINMVYANPPKFLSNPFLWLRDRLPRSSDEKEGFKRAEWFTKRGYGYNLEQATKPQTLGYALTDSPVGLLAWISEKLHDWTDDYPWTEDEVLTWISIYYFSQGTPASSLRIYYESLAYRDPLKSHWIPHVKLGMSFFPKELAPVPQHWGATLGPTVFQKAHPSGGHFAAYEKPDELMGDLREMFGRHGGAYRVIPGKSGFVSRSKL